MFIELPTTQYEEPDDDSSVELTATDRWSSTTSSLWSDVFSPNRELKKPPLWLLLTERGTVVLEDDLEKPKRPDPKMDLGELGGVAADTDDCELPGTLTRG